MDVLKKKRSILKGKVTRISNVLIPIIEQNEFELEDLGVYEKQINEVWNDLGDLHTEIMIGCKSEESDANEDEFNDLASRIDILKIKLARAESSKLKERNEILVNNSNSKLNGMCLRLPKYELQPFFGDSEKWMSFKELFLSSIDNNSELNDLQKMQYLVSSLRGSALKLISGLSLSEENYSHAWETLVARYDNKRDLAFIQVSKLFSLKQIKSGTSKSIFDILDTCNEVLRILSTLGFESNSLVEIIIIHFILNKLDDKMKQCWELSLSNQDIPKLKEFTNFLDKHAKSMPNKEATQLLSESKYKFVQKKSVVNSALIQKQENLCIMCRENHQLSKCSMFTKMSLDDRWNFIRSQKLCANCFRKNHFANKCVSNYTCKSCHRRHHTLLHRFYPNSTNHHERLAASTSNDFINSSASSHATNSENVAQVQENVQLSTTCCTTNSADFNTLLSTALIQVKNAQGNFVTCRALVDNGSQKSLISKDCCERLKLTSKLTNHSISGINNILVESSLAEVSLKFRPHFCETKYQVSALVVKGVTNDLPNFKFTSFNWPHLYGLTLADPTFAWSGPIDVLLGADIYSEIILGQPILGAKGTPAAINSHLGWLMSGRIFNCKSGKSVVNCHVTTSSLDIQLKEFWELESLPPTDLKSKDDRDCEQFFESTVTRETSGRYIVKLPFKSRAEFGDTASQASRRFSYLETKFKRDLTLNTQYSSFMKEYIQLGHMELVPDNELPKEKSFYLPHHYVKREDSTTTKLRVVFDASAKDSLGHSLNNTLHVGPRLQSELFQLLLRFRTFPIALTADIEKMFRQIKLHADDIDYQRIFWRFSPSESVQIYRLLTVTYGTACAPYLAVKTLQQLAKDEAMSFPKASSVLQRDFYVDDLLSGANSIPEAKKLVEELNTLLQKGGFNLRKWASNCPEVLADIPESALALQRDISIEETQSQKILGLHWNSKQDSLQVNITYQDEVKSKRNLLSIIARIFDPLGFLSPTTIILKLMMQDLWRNKLSWDEAVPEEILTTWQNFHSEMNYLKEIVVDRKLKPLVSNASEVQLHGFCDASTKAYAAVFYLRTKYEDGMVAVNMVAAKTRVAPLKTISLPRLELCAALLLSRLYNTISSSIVNFWNQVFLWSDSEIVLSWIRSDNLKDQFVKNRSAMITSLTELAVWKHVPGICNPADCASRGIFPKKLKDFEMWWHGPTWLSENNPEIPTTPIPSPIIDSSNISDTLVHTTSLDDANSEDLFEKYSSYSRLLRVIAWCRRFITNARNQPESRLTGRLQVSELSSSLLCIVRQVQQVHFKAEIHSLVTKGTLPRNSHYLPLSVFLDAEKILRVGGRLKHANLSSDAKHPMLLPKNNHFTKLIVEYYHKLSLHAGHSVVLSLIRQKFWIISGRDAIRRILRNCITCLKFNAKTSTQMMGNLPRERVTPSRPFQRVGLDYAGPIITKPNIPRSKIKLKSYIALFICFSTKAVHLELVSNLSSEAFLAAFRRFAARRGCPSDVYSDNATNFKGARNYLKDFKTIVNSSVVQDYVTEQQITWHFIPPLSPHFGGLWESNVKSAKRHLYKTCGAATLNFEELSTLLTQIEACLNSRPLYPLSSDPQDFETLTPGHFLIGAPLLSLPERDPSPSMSLKSRWCLLQSLRTKFWSQWNKDYLHTLQTKSKWTVPTSNMKIGDLVLLKDDSAPSPLKWSRARIVEVYPGHDGFIRVVRLRTAAGDFTRPVAKICPLPSQ